MHAMSYGFYSTKNPNQKAIELCQKFKTDTLLQKCASKNEYLAPQKFWENGKYTFFSIRKESGKFKKYEGFCLWNIWWTRWIIITKTNSIFRKISGIKKVEYLENNSQNVFIDRQNKFIDLIKYR